MVLQKDASWYPVALCTPGWGFVYSSFEKQNQQVVPCLMVRLGVREAEIQHTLGLLSHSGHQSVLTKGVYTEVKINVIFFFLGCATRHIESQFPDQGWNLCPLQWKREVLTTGPPGNSQNNYNFKNLGPVCLATPECVKHTVFVPNLRFIFILISSEPVET